MNVEVVTICSRMATEPYYRPQDLFESLRRFGEIPTVLGMNQVWRGLMEKPFLLREWLRAGMNKSDRLLVLDAFDVIVSQHPHGIGDRCAELCDDAVLFNCEKGIFPRGDLEGTFPNEAFGPWRFLNSGVFCGPADKILELLEIMDIDSIGFDPPGGPYPNDQGEWQQVWANSGNRPAMALDTKCLLFQTLSACDIEEFDLEANPVKNKITDTTPGIWHFNGSGMNLLGPTFREKWGYQ